MLSGNLKIIWAVLLKDLKSEFRTRYAISAVFLFILTTITIIVFSTAGEKFNTALTSGMLWVIMFFASMTGMAKSFVSEEERGTSLLLKLNTDSTSIYFGKLLFNILLALAINLLAIILFLLFINLLEIKHLMLFSITVLIGSVGLAGSTTIISAIISRANTKNALFPVLSLPILMPLILLGIDATKASFDGTAVSGISATFVTMIAFCGIIITTSYLLFDIVWKD